MLSLHPEKKLPLCQFYFLILVFQVICILSSDQCLLPSGWCWYRSFVRQDKQNEKGLFLPVNPRTHTGTMGGCPQRYISYPFSSHPYCLCCPTSRTLNSTHKNTGWIFVIQIICEFLKYCFYAKCLVKVQENNQMWHYDSKTTQLDFLS